jgi:hypothetical protein
MQGWCNLLQTRVVLSATANPTLPFTVVMQHLSLDNNKKNLRASSVASLKKI